ncbi:MAG TPA: ATP synthase F1 subunit epsilon [Alphaproteobacteria bacterium]|nr:ATP synthase F1 subunit epsilon [Alphaproteobacteria bacterium]
MADGKVTFELVAPERLLVSADVDMVVVPGTEGDFGVLPGHAPLIATVRAGIIDIYDGSIEPKSITQRIFVAGGVAEVTETRCTVLAEQAAPLADLTAADAQARLAAAQARVTEAGADEIAKARALKDVAVAEAMIAAVAA